MYTKSLTHITFFLWQSQVNLAGKNIYRCLKYALLKTRLGKWVGTKIAARPHLARGARLAAETTPNACLQSNYFSHGILKIGHGLRSQIWELRALLHRVVETKSAKCARMVQKRQCANCASFVYNVTNWSFLASVPYRWWQRSVACSRSVPWLSWGGWSCDFGLGWHSDQGPRLFLPWKPDETSATDFMGPYMQGKKPGLAFTVKGPHSSRSTLTWSSWTPAWLDSSQSHWRPHPRRSRNLCPIPTTPAPLPHFLTTPHPTPAPGLTHDPHLEAQSQPWPSSDPLTRPWPGPYPTPDPRPGLDLIPSPILDKARPWFRPDWDGPEERPG